MTEVDVILVILGIILLFDFFYVMEGMTRPWRDIF